MKTCKSIFIIVRFDQLDQVDISRFALPGDNVLQEINVMHARKFNHDVRLMLRSDLVITVGDWYEDTNCNKAVQVARIMDIEVINETTFQNYVEQTNN